MGWPPPSLSPLRLTSLTAGSQRLLLNYHSPSFFRPTLLPPLVSSFDPLALMGPRIASVLHAHGLI